jgi:hypothetical protein
MIHSRSQSQPYSIYVTFSNLLRSRQLPVLCYTKYKLPYVLLVEVSYALWQEHPISTKGEFHGVGRPRPRFFNKEGKCD